MDLPELSLAPSSLESSKLSLPMKRKSSLSDQASVVDLQLSDRLPLDWEQCLDLESGRMYYLNRKTLRKTWNWPKDQKLDLELNISSSSICSSEQMSRRSSSEMAAVQDNTNSCEKTATGGGGGGNMVALACLKCHLLVILSKSSPACPNCKYVHCLPPPNNSHQQISTPKISSTVKSLDTLSLLN